MAETITYEIPNTKNDVFNLNNSLNEELKVEQVIKKGLINRLLNYQTKKNNRRIKNGEYEINLEKKFKKLKKVVSYIFKKKNNYTIVGKENLELVKNEPFILISNHQTALDPLYVSMALDMPSRWISKFENSKGVFGLFSNNYGTIYLDEKRSWTKKAKEEVDRTIKKGLPIGIFPEGTRNREKGLGYFHKGAAKLCLEYGIAFLPVAVKGGLSDSTFALKGDIEVRIGKPVYNLDLENNYQNSKKITKEMKHSLDILLNN